MLYESARPTSFDGYVWTDSSQKKQIMEWVQNPTKYPSLLFKGPTGTGKTTLAKIIVNELGERAESKFIGASVMSGVDDVRNTIIPFCQLSGFADIKIVILDEADRMSKQAQQMLRNIIDEFSDDVRFILTCNYDRLIIDPLKGRMMSVEIASLDREQYIDYLINVSDDTGFDFEENEQQFIRIVDDNYPNVRGALNAIQSIMIGNGVNGFTVSSWLDDVMSNHDIPDIRDILSTFQDTDYHDVYRELFKRASDSGSFEAIAIITDHISMKGNDMFPDIVLVDCILKLRNLDDFN